MTEPQIWMRQALARAEEAAAMGEVPVGCVIVHEPTGRVIGSGFNRRIIDRDPTAHAEMVAMRQAGAALDDWRLEECTLYVTLEPCPMCAGAIVNARIARLVYGCEDPKAGAVTTLYRLCQDDRLNHRLEVTGGLLADECAQVLRRFFQNQRAMGKRG